MEDVSESLSLIHNSFLSCASRASGGAFYLFNCKESVKGADVINNCRFLDYSATDTTPDGGAAFIRYNSKLIGLSNCLFSKCSAYYSGALNYYCSDYDEDK